MNLLYFFAIPVATILLSIVWQRIVDSPILVAITAFSIFILAVYIFDSTLLLLAIIYTLLSYITAVVSKFFFDRRCSSTVIPTEQINASINNNSTDTIVTNEDAAGTEISINNSPKYSKQTYYQNYCNRFYK